VNERFDASTVAGKEYQAAWASDAATIPLDFPALAPHAARKVAEMRTYAGQPDFASVDAERLRLLSMTRHPKWYQAFGGPKSICQLAKHLKSEGQWLTLYGQWSEVSHALGPTRFQRRDASNDPTTRLLRDSSEFSEVVGFSASFLIRSIRLVLGRFRPSENIGEWYLRDVRPHFPPEEFAPPAIP
jgi:4-alpha-glucanotransferase